MQVDNTVKLDPEGLNLPIRHRELPTLHEYHLPTQYTLVRSQVRALTEKKASKLSKSILNELEKRLLQRPQCQGFETFLVALILLSCVERMCWLFQTWDNHDTSMKVRPLLKFPVFQEMPSNNGSGPLPNYLHSTSSKVTPFPTSSVCSSGCGAWC